MIITVRDDLTVNVTTEDGLFECELPNYNPETQVIFANKEVAKAFAKSIAGNMNYFVSKLTDEQKEQKKFNEKSDQVRMERNRLLSATDWRFRSDLTPSQEWKDYCQALRDISSQPEFPFEVTWPTAPE